MGTRNRPLPWTALQAFEAASRLGSFKAAALELSVTPTAISHQVKRLETQLGQVLFERAQRPPLLTAPGRVLAKETRRAFTGVEAVLRQLMLDGPSGAARPLTLSVVPSLAAKWLAPRLHRFQQGTRRTALRIVEAEALVDFRRDRTIDIALRYGPGGYGATVHQEPLWARNALVAVCAPSLVKRLRLRAPNDVGRSVLIRTALPARGRRSNRVSPSADWLAWLSAAGVEANATIRRALEGPVFGTTQLSIEAAMAGQGIALAPAVLVEKDLAARRLVCPFSVRLEDDNRFWIVCRQDRLKEAHLRAFIQWLRQEASSSRDA